MILPIRLRYPTLNPKQTGGRTSTSRFCANPIPNPLPTQIKTTSNNIPATLPTSILSTSSRPPRPDMSGEPTRRTPIHHHWPTRLNRLLHYPPIPLPYRKCPRKQNTQLLNTLIVYKNIGLVNQRLKAYHFLEYPRLRKKGLKPLSPAPKAGIFQ